MKTMKGPAIFLAQFAGDAAPFNSLAAIAKWASVLGYKGIQIPTWDARLFDLEKAARSKTYCDEIAGVCREAGVEITELSTHLQGQLVAVHPAYDAGFDGFAAPAVRGNPKARQRWAVKQVLAAAKASRNLGLDASVTFSGALAWPYLYPWPPRSPGLIEAAFDELAKRWKPIFDAYDEAGVDVGFELHPGEDIMDGDDVRDVPRARRRTTRAAASTTTRRTSCCSSSTTSTSSTSTTSASTRSTSRTPSSTRPAARASTPGFQSWVERAGRFRSLGDGQVDFGAIFSKLAQYDYDRWPVLEWECALKHPEQGAAEGAPFIESHIIRVTEHAFDDFAGGATDVKANKKALGI